MGFSGDGGPATSAELNYPKGLAIDTMGNLYVADCFNSVIRQINTAGIISTIAGTGGMTGYSGDGASATLAKLLGPYALAVDDNGNIYVADVGNYRIRKINTSGIITTIAGNGIAGYGGDGGPADTAEISRVNGIAVDSTGNVFISDADNQRIRMINTDGIINTIGGNGVAGNSGIGGNALLANLFNPQGICLDAAHNLYVCDYSNAAVRKISKGAILSVGFYNDANSNCAKDAAEPLNSNPIVMEVDSNGIAIDTVSSTGSLAYLASGHKGDIYQFKLLSVAGNVSPSCPVSGIIIDTILSSGFYSKSKYIGLSCSGGSSFDLIEHVNTRAGRHQFEGDILINNTYCSPQSTVFTTDISPKYNLQNAYPAPSSVVGNTLTWDFGSVSAFTTQPHIHFTCEVPGTWLSPGDTIHSDYTVNPSTGDIDPSSNICIKVDTVKSSWDPNEMTVTPEGYIPSGTLLQYYVEFENDGNDTAKNIYVLDTLSQYLDATSLRVVTASAVLNTTVINSGGYRILKFDFPGINLLDSTHHNQCTGMVIFTIKSKADIPNGTLIRNEAGIFFDDNPVVKTNGVTNTIGFPTSVSNMAVNSKIQLFPNPAHDNLTITSADGINTLSINNFMGQMVYSNEYNSPKATVDVSSLPAGVYFVKVNGAEVRKFVKQ